MAFAIVVVSVTVAVILQWAIQWSGDRNEFILLSALNLYLATQAAWFFNVRWKSLGDRVDLRVRNVFLPIVAHFAFRLVVEILPIDHDTVELVDRISWISTQLLAAVLVAYVFQSGPRLQRLLGTGRIAVVAAAVAIAFQLLERSGITEGVRPAELGLTTAFLLATLPRLATGLRQDWRELWLGAAFLLVALAHANIAWSRASFDEPFM